MPYTDKFAIVQSRYPEPLSIVLRRLLNEGGYMRAAIEFGVTEQTISNWMDRLGIARECVYLLPGEAIAVVEAEQERTA